MLWCIFFLNFDDALPMLENEPYVVDLTIGSYPTLGFVLLLMFCSNQGLPSTEGLSNPEAFPSCGPSQRELLDFLRDAVRERVDEAMKGVQDPDLSRQMSGFERALDESVMDCRDATYTLGAYSVLASVRYPDRFYDALEIYFNPPFFENVPSPHVCSDIGNSHFKTARVTFIHEVIHAAWYFDSAFPVHSILFHQRSDDYGDCLKKAGDPSLCEDKRASFASALAEDPVYVLAEELDGNLFPTLSLLNEGTWNSSCP